MKIYIITPYEGMLKAIKDSIAYFPNILFQYAVGDLKKGVEIAKKAENDGYDAIISRGGTAQLIQKNVDIPVIDMGLSGYDILKTIIIANSNTEKSALIGFSNITSGAAAILDILELETEIYTIENENEVYNLLVNLKEQGVNYIIGDVITTEKANDLNLHSILLQSGEETIKSAIKQAHSILQNHNDNEFKHLLLANFFKSIHEDYLLIKDQQIIDVNLKRFNSNPLNQERIYTILHDTKEKNNKKQFYFGDFNLTVDVLQHTYLGKEYKLLLLNQIDKDEYVGVRQRLIDPFSKLVLNSDAMMKAANNLKNILLSNDVPYFIGQDNFTKDSLIQFIYNNIDKQGEILEINFDQANMNQLISYKWHNTAIIRAINLQNRDQLNFILEISEKNNIIPIITDNYTAINESILSDENIIPIQIPSFESRIDDIFEVANYFISQHHNKNGTKPIRMSEETNNYILSEHEFKSMDEYLSIIKEAIYIENKYTLTIETIRRIFKDTTKKEENLFKNTKKTLSEIEYAYIEAVVKEENFNQTSAAKRLGISRSTLWRKYNG